MALGERREKNTYKEMKNKNFVSCALLFKSGISVVLFSLFNHFLFVGLNLVTFSRKDFDKKAIKDPSLLSRELTEKKELYLT